MSLAFFLTSTRVANPRSSCSLNNSLDLSSLRWITTTKGIGAPLRLSRIMCRGAYLLCCNSSLIFASFRVPGTTLITA
nr:unnamed protein product [Callosobruchus analis]